jgi:hypothetical protein
LEAENQKFESVSELWEWVAGRCKEIEQRPAFNSPFDGSVTVIRNEVIPVYRVFPAGGKLPLWLPSYNESISFSSREKAMDSLKKNRNLKLLGSTLSGTLTCDKLPSLKIKDFMPSPEDEALARMITEYFTLLVTPDPRGTGMSLFCGVLDKEDYKEAYPFYLDAPGSSYLERNIRSIFGNPFSRVSLLSLSRLDHLHNTKSIYKKVKEEVFIETYRIGKKTKPYALKNK